MKLFNTKAMAEIWKADNRFCWGLRFDTNTGLYEINCPKSYDTPIEAVEAIKEFAKENEFEYEISWELL